MMKKKMLIALCVVGLMFCVASPALSTEADLETRIGNLENAIGAWSFYGSARVSSFWTSQDEEAGDDSEFALDMQGNSRLGATVKLGDLGGGFEFAVDDDAGVNTRKLYGTYNFGDAQILVGQTYTPVNMFYSNQVYGNDTDMLNFAPAYNSRRPMIQFAMDGFKVALVKQHAKGLVTVDGLDASTEEYETDEAIPKVEARYHFAQGSFFGDVYGGYQTYKISSTTTKDYNINSYVAGVGGGVTLDPVTIKVAVYAGQNVGQYGLWTQGVDDAVIETGEVKDVQTIAEALILTLKANDMVSFEAGLGFISHDSDSVLATEDDEAMVAYGQSVIKIAKGFMIVPEVGYYDYKKSNT